MSRETTKDAPPPSPRACSTENIVLEEVWEHGHPIPCSSSSSNFTASSTAEVLEAHRLKYLQSLSWFHRPSIVWLFPFVFLLAIMMGVSAVPQDQLIIRIICKAHFRNMDGYPSVGGDDGGIGHGGGGGLIGDDECNTPVVQAIAAGVMSRLASLKSVIAIFTVGFYTTKSDILGRKYLVYLTLLPFISSQMLIIYMSRSSSNLSTAWLYVNALIEGCLGAGSLLEPAMNAYVADCTPRDRRSLAIGYLMVVVAVGIILGPGLGAYLIEVTGDISSALMLSVAVLGLLILYTAVIPESRPKESIHPDSFGSGSTGTRTTSAAVAIGGSDAKTKASSPLNKIKRFLIGVLDPLQLFLPGRIEPASDVNILPSRYTLVLLVTAYALMQFSESGTTTIFIPYSNLKYKWTTLEDGVYFTFFGAVTLVIYIAIFPAMQFFYKFFTTTRVSTSTSTLASTSTSSSELMLNLIDERAPLLQEVTTTAGLNAIDEAMVHIHQESTSPKDGNAADKKNDGGKDAEDSIWKDLWFFLFGAILSTIGYAIIPIFETEVILFISCGVRALASVGAPSFTSLLTSYVPSHQTGKALGGICVLDAMLSTVASLLFGWIFAKTSETMPSAVYVVSTAISMCSAAATVVLWSMYRGADKRSL